MLKKIAEVLKLEAPYRAFLNPITDKWYVSPDPDLKTFKIYYQAKDYCEELNRLWMARKIVEAMREAPDDNKIYDNYLSDILWRDLNSKDVWNKWIDAILKE